MSKKAHIFDQQAKNSLRKKVKSCNNLPPMFSKVLEFVTAKFPEYNNRKGFNRLNNIVRGLTAGEPELVDFLVFISKQYAATDLRIRTYKRKDDVTNLS